MIEAKLILMPIREELLPNSLLCLLVGFSSLWAAGWSLPQSLATWASPEGSSQPGSLFPSQ